MFMEFCTLVHRLLLGGRGGGRGYLMNDQVIVVGAVVGYRTMPDA